jgi:transcription termination factor Rho
MTKAELESKSLADLHDLAAERGVERYRMLSRGELIDKLSDGEAGGGSRAGRQAQRGGARGERQRDRQRKPRESRQREPRGDRGGRERGGRQRDRRPEKREQQPPPPPAESAPAAAAPSSDRPRRKRRRRRWGRRRKEVTVQDLLLPGSGARTIVYGESRAACTALLREVAGELSGSSGGPDPIALLVDPSPEELADWKRDAPQVEIVAAGQSRHATDAMAQASRRAEAGEDVIVLIDSLSRFGDAFKAANEAKDLFDAGQSVGGTGSVTVVAAVERSA